MKIENIEIRHYKFFEKLFVSYFEELDCEDDPLHVFSEYVLEDLKAGLLQAAMVFCGEEAAGFVIYQVDDVINDWCFKDGWGDVREIFVTPKMRGQKLGKALLAFAEERLSALGADGIYTLPTEESEKFFISCGYEDAGEYCAELDGKVFAKTCTHS